MGSRSVRKAPSGVEQAAHTRQVTVTRVICGVEITSSSLEERIGHGHAPSRMRIRLVKPF